MKSEIRKRTGKFFSEFWEFAAKGNAIQLAIAVVVGGAFGTVVNSLVNNIITPLLSLLTREVDFTSWGYTLREAAVAESGQVLPAVVLGYGQLLQAILNFFVVGLSIFIIVKLISRIVKRLERKEKQEEKAAPPVPISTQEKLLGEIRDILKERSQGTGSGPQQ